MPSRSCRFGLPGYGTSSASGNRSTYSCGRNATNDATVAAGAVAVVGVVVLERVRCFVMCASYLSSSTEIGVGNGSGRAVAGASSK